MDFSGVIQQLIGLGLPLLGNMLGGPLGGAVASIIAKAIGAPDASAEAIGTTLATTEKDVAIAKLQKAQAESIAYMNAQLELGKTEAVTVAETIKSEITTAISMTGTAGRFIQFIQLSWRPMFAYETLLECVGMAIVAIHEIWTADFSTLNSMMQFQGFLTWYFGLKFGLLGVYSIGRSYEKGSETAVNIPSGWINQIVAAIKKK